MGIGSGSKVSASGEKMIFYALKQNLQPPYCIFDVGSNKGQFLNSIIENLSSDDFFVHCFEPGHESHKILVENFPQDDRIKLNNLGLGQERGEAVLYYDKPGSGIASLTKRNLDHFGIEFSTKETIAIDTVDNYCSEHSIKKIDLLKVDVEGHELDVFTGAKKMFDMRAIEVVTFEFGGCNIDTRTFFQNFWYFFAEVNMKISRITPTGYFYPIESYKEIDEQFRTTNFIALKNEYQH
jgi:FkbM family methyltransferase